MIAVCPFASRVAFEIRIFPTEHTAYFEKASECQKQCLAEALQVGNGNSSPLFGNFT